MLSLYRMHCHIQRGIQNLVERMKQNGSCNILCQIWIGTTTERNMMGEPKTSLMS
jgi:hypothetical protein